LTWALRESRAAAVQSQPAMQARDVRRAVQ
jgi:hypothetical protein